MSRLLAMVFEFVDREQSLTLGGLGMVPAGSLMYSFARLLRCALLLGVMLLVKVGFSALLDADVDMNDVLGVELELVL